ncbi:hypothetical protein [Cellulomonas edaphi]|uniref:Uncharacterized protein n=1 Tax=Cellulomonas edaphi TaxID=3053468 RepID=A0ABT7S4E0_9CELL|nr:hypothetical protein [Cellulomons edaphi]MDM7829882.1 hypothetical protein [Cellulomons edaphi]
MYSVDFAVAVTAAGEFRCYIGAWPFVWSSGALVPPPRGANQVTHRVVVYGDIWLRTTSGRDASYTMQPIG